MDNVSPPLLVGGSISLVGLLGTLVKLWLGALERRQMERDIETKSQLGAIFTELKRAQDSHADHDTRIALGEGYVERLEDARKDHERRIRTLERDARTPSGKFRIPVRLGDEDDE